MAASTAVYTLTTAAYTQLSEGEASVLIQVMNQGAAVRLHLGQSLPVAGTNDWFPMGNFTRLGEREDRMLFEGLGSTDIVYARANEDTTEVRVLKR